MRSRPGCLLAPLLVAAAGCASAPPGASEASPPPPREGPIPEVLADVPPPVIVDRALADLATGDPGCQARARCVLLALPDSALLDPLRLRARDPAGPQEQRLEAVALLLERGEAAGSFPAGDVVGACLRSLARVDGDSRGALLALDRLRGMGGEARVPLREEARAAGPLGDVAARVLRSLYREERPLPDARP